jgi:ribosomal protein L11 methyltransferase
VTARVPTAEAEPARARFLDLFPIGFEEHETSDALELSAYTDARGERNVRAAFASVASALVEPGWEDRWRDFHRPVRAGGLWIGPPWRTPPSGVAAVVVEPGRVFGTGAHGTTRACVELLARTPRDSVLDAGCGSGVLAIAAALLGFAPVTAVDVDPAALEATRANAARNGVEVDVRVGDVLSDDLPAADVLVANIELPTVERLLRRWPGRRAIVSGYLAHETPRADGWTREARLVLEGWAADCLSRTTV